VFQQDVDFGSAGKSGRHPNGCLVLRFWITDLPSAMALRQIVCRTHFGVAKHLLRKNITFGRALLYVAKAGDSQILGLCCTGKLKNNLAAF
jgi:hypothetical protein